MNTGAEPQSLGHWSLDPRKMELQASAACRRNHGRNPHDDSTYEQVLASIHPDDRDRVREAVRRAFEEGEDYEEQYRTILPSGEVRNILARGRLQQPSNGGAPQLAGTTLDVTGGASGRGEPEQTILEAAGEGIYGLNASGRVTFVNPAAQRMVGREAVEMIGKRMHDEIHHSRPDGSPYLASECPLHAILRGGVVHRSGEEVFWRADGSSFAVSYTATPTIEDGEITGAVVTFSDITSRKRAEAEREQVRRRMEFLAEASIRLADSLDWEQTLSEIARLAVPRICDLCIVDTLDAPGEDSSVRRLAAAHHDPYRERLAWELEERYPVHSDERSGIAEVIRTGRSTLITEVDDEWLGYMSQDESHLKILRGLDLGSIAIVPLVTHGRILGTLTLASDGSGRHYDEEDLALAEDLARRAAQSMDNARLYEEQTHAARTLQQSLLPPSLPEIPGMEAAARFRPATSAAGAASGGYNIGGDFYDLFQTPAGWVVVVGDVMGKGVEAAELTAMVRYTLRTAAMSGELPSTVISTLNSAMLNQRSDLKFCTLACGLLNETREGGSRLTLCRGGHPPPLILRAGGTVEEAGKRGLLVGIEPDPGWSDAVVELSEGDSVIFYTDGLTEARNPEGRMFGAHRLEDLAASCRDLGASQTADALEHGVAEFQDGESPRDDVALLVIRATIRATGEEQPQ